MAAAPYPYGGPEALHAPVLAALTQVVDPELALSTVDIGLVRGMSAEDALDRALPPGRAVEGVVEWPPWTPASMSERARRFLDG